MSGGRRRSRQYRRGGRLAQPGINQNDSELISSDSEAETVKCGKCDNIVNEEDNAICCDACGIWFHAGCIKMSTDSYKAIERVHEWVSWFCKNCKIKMTRVVAKLNDIEVKLDNFERSIEAVIEEKVQEYVNERMDREKRKDNIVIYSLKEAPDDITDSTSRIDYDTELVTSLHEGVSGDLAIAREDVIQVVRLGKTLDRRSQKPRPLKVKFKDTGKKRQILKAAVNLKDAEGDLGWKSEVCIAHDYTIRQRKKQQKLWEELKQRRNRGEDDIMIRNSKIVKRSTFQGHGGQ